MHLIVSKSGAVFWQNRKLVNASDCLRIKCSSLTKFGNPPVHLTITSSDIVFLTNPQIRQCTRSFQRWVQHFWQHRKLVCASDASSASDATLTNPIKSSNSISIKILISILINISFNISNQHFSSTNIISAKITSAQKHESNYISFSSIIIFFFHVSIINQN